MIGIAPLDQVTDKLFMYGRIIIGIHGPEFEEHELLSVQTDALLFEKDTPCGVQFNEWPLLGERRG